MDEHKPVLLNEVLEHLNIQTDGIYIDATFGRGGHTKAILAQLGDTGMVIALDKDTAAIEYAKTAIHDPRFHIEHSTFSDVSKVSEQYHVVGRVNGMLCDLGVSSPQLDESERGFSFLRDGPLDMRMDRTQTPSAAEWLETASEQEISKVLWEYGEERYARKIAKAIIESREQTPLTTTRQLSDLIESIVPRQRQSQLKSKHPATRSFQAIRIFINRELEELKQYLAASLEVLAIGGRLLVISFHSLEDRITKRFIYEQEVGKTFSRYAPENVSGWRKRLRTIARIRAGAQELSQNPRARSAVLRVVEKIA